jgi:hypothetical protein
MMGQIMPVLTQVAMLTRNEAPINGFLKAMGRAMEMDVEEFLLPPLSDSAAMQQQEQLAQQLQEAQVREANAKADKLESEAQATGQEGAEQETQQQIAVAQAQHQMQSEAAQRQQAMEHAQQLQEQTIRANAMKMWQHLQSRQLQDAMRHESHQQALSLKAQGSEA